jgi:hypothetical protein
MGAGRLRRRWLRNEEGVSPIRRLYGVGMRTIQKRGINTLAALRYTAMSQTMSFETPSSWFDLLSATMNPDNLRHFPCLKRFLISRVIRHNSFGGIDGWLYLILLSLSRR